MVRKSKSKRSRPKNKPKSVKKKRPKPRKKVKKIFKKKMSKSKKIAKILRSQIIKNKLETIVNEKGLELVKILLKRKQINEFKLAGKLKIKVNKVRSLLYKLYSKKIATYTRKRDKRKGL